MISWTRVTMVVIQRRGWMDLGYVLEAEQKQNNLELH